MGHGGLAQWGMPTGHWGGEDGPGGTGDCVYGLGGTEVSPGLVGHVLWLCRGSQGTGVAGLSQEALELGDQGR